MSVAVLDGCALDCETAGREDAPAPVFALPLGGSGDPPEPQLWTVADRFRVVRDDGRGHGRPAAPGRDTARLSSVEQREAFGRALDELLGREGEP